MSIVDTMQTKALMTQYLDGALATRELRDMYNKFAAESHWESGYIISGGGTPQERFDVRFREWTNEQ